MSDKYLMENLIFGSKVLNNLLMHGVIEASNEKVNATFLKALQESLKVHYEIFLAMERVGFYTVENVLDSKIEQLKTKLDKVFKECECLEER